MENDFTSLNTGLRGLLSGETTMGELLSRYMKVGQRIKKNSIRIFIVALIGALCGGVMAYLNPQKMQAVMIIAVEDDDSNGWQNLLSQFGIDVGGNNPGGIFKGESLVQLFSTRNQVERMLLRNEEFESGNFEIVANRLLKSSKLSQKSQFTKVIFTQDRSHFTALQDSLLMLLYEETIEEILRAEKPEKKLSIIQVTATHRDKFVAKVIAETAVKQNAEYYIETLTRKARLNLDVLQQEADSVQYSMNQNMIGSALATDINVNPNRASLRVGQNRSLIDLQISVSLYGEIIKNLKLAEIGLRKQTPVIQIVDVPQFPLKQVGLKAYQWIIAGIIAFVMAYLFFLTLLPEVSPKRP